MINFFKMASNDYSIVYLSNIFGNMGGILPGNNTITMLSTMFATFNATVLAIGAMIIMYVTVVGVMKTAHEGEAMGKQWNNLWLPIRTVLGIATLVPTASGYSAIQIVMMWIILQGIAAADTLWSTALTARAIIGSPYSGVNLPDVGVATNMENLFTALVCDATVRMTNANPAGGSKGSYYCNSNTCSTPNSFDPEAGKYPIGPGGQCGTLTYCDMTTSCKDANSLQCFACKAQVDALTDIIPTLSSAAQQFAQADYTYRDFYYNSYNQSDNSNWQPIYDYCEGQNPSIPKEQCCNSSKLTSEQTCQGTTTFPDPDSSSGVGFQSANTDAVNNIYWPYILKSSLAVSTGSFIDAASTAYMGYLTTAFSNYITTAAQETGPGSGNIIGIPLTGSVFEVADQVGWIFAGSFYYSVATEGTGQSTAKATPTFTIDTSNAQTNFKNYRNNVDAASDLVNAADSGITADPTNIGGLGNSTSDSSSSTSGMPKIVKKIVKPIMSAFKGINKALNTVITSVGGPINALQAFGQLLMLTGEGLYLVVLVLNFILGSTMYINVYVLGTGADNPIWGGMLLSMMVVLPLVFAFIAWLIGTGGLLAVYLPLVPYIIFLVGVIGWFIAVIEAMVAAPLVALGILSPSGQHDLLGKSEPALMLIFNIFLRPSLMIFGMIAAMLLIVVVCQIIFMSFAFVAVSITHGVGLIDPIVTILFITAFMTLIVSSANKCFTMIHLVPAQVMQWIGGSHHTPGGAGGEDQFLSKQEGAIGDRGKTLGGLGGKAHEAREKKAEVKAKTDANKSAVQENTSLTGKGKK